MATDDTCCTIVPYFRVSSGMMDDVKALCRKCVEKTSSEPKCLYFGCTFSGDEVHIREGYEDAQGVLHHLDNIKPLLDEILKLADLVRLEIHGPESELQKLREPLKELSPHYYTLEYGFRR